MIFARDMWFAHGHLYALDDNFDMVDDVYRLDIETNPYSLE